MANTRASMTNKADANFLLASLLGVAEGVIEGVGLETVAVVVEGGLLISVETPGSIGVGIIVVVTDGESTL